MRDGDTGTMPTLDSDAAGVLSNNPSQQDAPWNRAVDLSESEPALVPREDGQYREEPGRRGTLDAAQGDDTAGHTSRTPR